MSFMKDKERHLREEDMIEYFYKESSLPEGIEGHINVCPRCNARYLRLRREMKDLTENYKREFWIRQRERIRAEIKGNAKEEKAAWSWRAALRPAFAAALLVFLAIGIYYQAHRIPVGYTQKDMEEELLLERVSELVSQPLTTALDDFSFQMEEDTQDEEDVLEEYTYPSEQLDMFGFWPELDA